MSLLTTPNADVTVYPEEAVTDGDGNTLTRPAAVGVPAKARIQPLGASTEGQSEGFESRSRYSMRLIGWTGAPLGAQSQVDWLGDRWSVYGDPQRYNGSPRTARLEYEIRRY